jgi:hypothetical protein
MGSQNEQIAVLKLNENIYGTDGSKAGGSCRYMLRKPREALLRAVTVPSLRVRI